MTLPASIGRYRIRSEIARGAMGVVYEALDPVLERVVALKAIDFAPGSDADGGAGCEEQLLLEARAAAALNHPNIVTIHDAGCSGGLAYIAMEYLEGCDLEQLLASDTFCALRALDIAAQIADGLAYAHARGVVHQDVKPANVVVAAGARVKIADFGVARRQMIELAPHSGFVRGSPAYLAPERLRGKPCDGRCDIFSLGVILYRMLTGRTPFGGADTRAVVDAILHSEPLPPSAATPGLPARLDAIVGRALAKDPHERYADAAQLASDLRACRAELAVIGVPRPPAATDEPRAPSETVEVAVERTEGEVPAAVRTTRANPGAGSAPVLGTDEVALAPAQAPSEGYGLAPTFDSEEALRHFRNADTAADDPAAPGESLQLAVHSEDPQPQSEEASAPGPSGPVRRRWTACERFVFCAGVACAALLGALIVIL